VSELAGPFKMALPFFSQHLRVLEDCGRVRSHKEGRGRTYRLEPRRLKAAEGWMVKQRAVWERRLDPLDAYLDEIAHSGTESPTRLRRWAFGPCTRAGVSPKGAQAACPPAGSIARAAPSAALLGPSAPSLPLNRASLPPRRRGISYRLAEGLGVLSQWEAREQWRLLDDDSRERLKALGVREGQRFLYVAEALAPHALVRRRMLTSLLHQSPAPPGVPGAPVLAAADLGGWDARVFGDEVTDSVALRIDVFERLSEALRHPHGSRQVHTLMHELRLEGGLRTRGCESSEDSREGLRRSGGGGGEDLTPVPGLSARLLQGRLLRQGRDSGWGEQDNEGRPGGPGGAPRW